jgi:hypothetical protein
VLPIAWLVACGARSGLDDVNQQGEIVPKDAASDPEREEDVLASEMIDTSCSSLHVLVELPVAADQMALDSDYIFVHYGKSVARVSRQTADLTELTTQAAGLGFPTFAHFAVDETSVLWLKAASSTSTVIRTAKSGATSTSDTVLQGDFDSLARSSNITWTWQSYGLTPVLATSDAQGTVTRPLLAEAQCAIGYGDSLVTAGRDGVAIVDSTTQQVLDATPAVSVTLAGDDAYYTTSKNVGLRRVKLPAGTGAPIVTDETALAHFGGVRATGDAVYYVDAKLGVVARWPLIGGPVALSPAIDAPWVPIDVVVAGPCAYVSAGHALEGTGRIYALPLP